MTEPMEVLVTFFIILVLIVLMTVLYAKLRVYPIIIVVFAFSLIIGVNSLSLSLPLTPYFQVFFLTYQTIVLFMASFDLKNNGGRNKA